MRKPYFIVTARCQRCPSPIFKANRKKIEKVGTDGQKYQIKKLVCPSCRMWADIVNITAIK